MDVEKLNWSILDRLRAGFLSGAAADGPYWQSREDLEQYDLTFGERIGWKWDAVLTELSVRKWSPRARETGGARVSDKLTILDWGCGSGVAGRRVISHFGADRFSKLYLWDHSPLARDFAATRAAAEFPHVEIESWPEGAAVDVLIVSHVINELDSASREQILALVRSSQSIIWVEPGTHAISRDLIGLREKIRGEFRVIAPCTHNAICGLLAPQNTSHWCHAFAAPPSAIYADSDWVKFGQRAGIDLRSLPYSFLVLEKPDTPKRTDIPSGNTEAEVGAERILGDPRHFKGYAKILSCAAEGVRELTLQKRDDPAMFKQLKREVGVPIYRWSFDKGYIRTAEHVYPKRDEAVEPVTNEME